MKPNYVAVLVAALAYWLLGAVWYSVLFQKAWMALENISPEQAQAAGAPIAPLIISFVLNLVIAFVLAQLCAWRNANTAARGAALGILIWIGFLGPVTYTTYMFEMRPKQLFAINEFYVLVGMCLMGAILGAWPKKKVA
jgi:surface polysaccharide O-acyltransferase-like enzyme